MAMTLRLTARETDALRRRALAEQTSMQELTRRALDEYLAARTGMAPLDVLLDEELGRYAGAIKHLGRWRD